MKFTMTIESGNAAMVEDVGAAVAEILRKVADAVDVGCYRDGVRDGNGNRVGSWELTTSE